jgi:outer membrane protein assembly factor BamE (lipoprotein component of BamABCDE complex)
MFHSKIIYFIIFLLLANCNVKKASNIHGISSLKNKSNNIIINKSNKNDVKNLLGPPSVKSNFDENLWIYLETKKTNQSIYKLGMQKIVRNNVLVVYLNDLGIVSKKEFYDINNLNKIKFSKKTTENIYKKDTYLYNLLSSLREKMNAPFKNKN